MKSNKYYLSIFTIILTLCIIYILIIIRSIKYNKIEVDTVTSRKLNNLPKLVDGENAALYIGKFRLKSNSRDVFGFRPHLFDIEYNTGNDNYKTIARFNPSASSNEGENKIFSFYPNAIDNDPAVLNIGNQNNHSSSYLNFIFNNGNTSKFEF